MPGELAPFLWVDDVPGDEATAARPSPGDRDDGLWVLVLGDLTLFAVLFVVLLAERRGDRAGFAATAGELLAPVGLANAVVLLAGSWLVVLATGAHRGGDVRRTRCLLLGAAGLGGVFVAAKAVEYTVELSRGLADRGLFAALYLVITGLHLLHVLVGLVLLSWWRRRAGDRSSRLAEVTAVYWHMVDLLWVVIVTLVYVVVRAP